MALMDDLNAGPPSRSRVGGVVERWRESLDGDTLAAFDAAVRDPAWSTSALLRTLRNGGLKVAHSTLSLYRESL